MLRVIIDDTRIDIDPGVDSDGTPVKVVRVRTAAAEFVVLLTRVQADTAARLLAAPLPGEETP